MPVKAYHPRYLRLALDSLLAQTDPGWRLAIITERRLRRRLAAQIGPYLQDPRIACVSNEGRKLAGAFNTGMRHAPSEFVAILFGDDMWAPEAVAVLRRAIRSHPEVEFFHSSRRVIGDSGEPLSSVHRSRPDVRLEHFGSPSPVKHLLCWRRSKALSFGGMDESLDSVGPDDFDFPWSMAEEGAVFHAIPECLYIYRDHRSSERLTTHLPLNVHMREMRRIMHKHGMETAAIDSVIEAAQESYLRQCVYRTWRERWWRECLGLRPASVWRGTYR